MTDSKLFLFVFTLVSNYFATFFVIGLVAALVSIFNKPKPVNTVTEAFFSYYMLFTIGISNLINFIFHVFFGDMAAKFIGWENSTFPAEVGFASLGIGIGGVIASKAGLPFRFAAHL
jgi:hypothetical protein